MRLAITALITVLAGCASTSTNNSQPSAPAAATPAAKPAPLFANLGNFARPISTRNAQAQRYFNQGLTLTYGFNHAEAKRSFLAALSLDPKCAICAWGAALVLGPNINLPMSESDNAEANALARRAQSLAAKASPVEQALIEALAKRYAEPWAADRSALDRAYASAMRLVASRYSGDADVQALFAESLLDLYPWNYWLPGGEPRPETSEAIAAIDRSLASNPKHPGALHYRIHALEEFRPQEAVAAADALRGLVPDAGHLVHMPGHIYLRVGRYLDSLDVNIDAGKADDSYVAQCQVQGFYPLAYHPHNWHFVAVSASMLGNRKLAMEGAAKTGHLMHGQAYTDPMIGLVVQHFDLLPLMTAMRLGLWEQVLATPMPTQAGDYARGLTHIARGMALSARGDAVAARAELAALQVIVAKPELATAYVSVRNTVQGILAVGERMLAGELLLRDRNVAGAIAALRDGVAREDALGYNEPEDWNYPVRLLLGAALLEAGRHADAEQAYREDLAKHPGNGWALFGLARSLRDGGRVAEAEQAEKQFAAAWQRADFTLTADRVDTGAAALQTAIAGSWRSPEARARDVYRHPAESLAFWGLKPGMTILELQPGAASWWTDILAPYARMTGGSFHATGANLADPKLSAGARKMRADFEARYADAAIYGKVNVVDWGRDSAPLPPNSFDFVLLSRSFHGWMADGSVKALLKRIYDGMKPGGILAIEQHRANPGVQDPKADNGYVTEAYLIEQLQKAGFKLQARSEINANPKDTKDHPFGVWTLPPTRNTAPFGQPVNPAFDRTKYDAIGESDRMTLRFVK